MYNVYFQLFYFLYFVSLSLAVILSTHTIWFVWIYKDDYHIFTLYHLDDLQFKYSFKLKYPLLKISGPIYYTCIKIQHNTTGQSLYNSMFGVHRNGPCYNVVTAYE